LGRLVERESQDLELERIARLAEVDELDLVPDLRRGLGGVRLREPEVAFEAVERGPTTDWSSRERVRHELDAGERRVCRLEGQWGCDLRRWELQNVSDRYPLAQNLGEARGRAHARRIGRVGDAQVVAGPADRIEHRLARRQEAESVRPAVIIRRAIGV